MRKPHEAKWFVAALRFSNTGRIVAPGASPVSGGEECPPALGEDRRGEVIYVSHASFCTGGHAMDGLDSDSGETTCPEA